MTFKHISEDHGLGGGAFDRFHSGPTGPAIYYGGHRGYDLPTYHPPPPTGHIYNHYSFSHSNGGGASGKGGGGPALSALTLLSFLFFLSILQQCLKDQMAAMTPQVMVMSSGREEIMPKVKEDKSNLKTKLHQDHKYQDDKTYTLIESFARSQPENSGTFTETTSSIPEFVNAMGDGVGEIINEQR